MTSRRALLIAAGAVGAVAAAGDAHAGSRQTLQLARDYVLGFLGRGDTAIADRVLDPKIKVTTGLSPTGPIIGLPQYKEIFLSFRDAFPHVDEMVIVDSFAANDRAMIRFNIRQRHEKAYFGVAPTRRVILFDETHVMTVRAGKVVENIVSATNLEFEMLLAPVLSPLILR